MFKGVSTLEIYEQCLKRGLCECHIKEVYQDEIAVQQDELPRKAFLFIRVNILYTILFKKSTKCDKIKILLQRTPIFSRILANGDASEAADAILVLDSVVIFTLCQLSKICCIGALFQKNYVTSEDTEIRNLQKLLLIDRFEGSVLSHLYPIFEKNFAGYDMDVIKVSYVLTLLFVRNYCIKLNVKIAVETIEEDLRGNSQWENFKTLGDCFCDKGNFKEAISAYTSAVMLNSYSSELFAQRAQGYLKIGKWKAAQLDAYIAVIIDPKCCKGYYAFSSSFFHQKLYQDAYNVAKYGLEICESSESFYETLQTLSVEIEMKYFNKEKIINSLENAINENDPTPKHSQPQKYFPELVDSDSNDSDSETYDVKNYPELVGTSDSDENEVLKQSLEKKMSNTQPKNKKKKRTISEGQSDVIHISADMIKSHLKEASEAITLDCGYKALQIFRGPLRSFIDLQLKTFEECDIVCIKYAYGIAYCKSGGYDDLIKSISIFKDIIEKYDSVTFPAAYHALGLVHRKLNRFKEALNYLEIVKDFLDKGIHFKVYSWPEITAVIPETKPDILKVLVENLIKECENPPNPDALCRFAHCSFQPPIYYTDPDFKGYISLMCSEQCCLQYHFLCWKNLKAEKELTDKEFLEKHCFTPDCDGVIIKIQNIDKKGNLAKEFTSDFKKSLKQKWAKWEKKSDVKEKKKKKANSKADEVNQDIISENGKVYSRKNSDASEKASEIQISDSSVDHTVEKETASLPESDPKTPINMKAPMLDSSVKSSSDICCLSSNCETAFQDTQDSEKRDQSGIIKNTKVSEKDDSVLDQKMSEVSFASQNRKSCDTSDYENKKFDKKLIQENPSDFLVSQCIKKEVYSYMSDFLQLHGPLRTDDPILTDEISSFPDDVNIMIADYGGIGEFLKNDLRFAFVSDRYVCVVSDLATAYKMSSSSSLPSNLEGLQSLDSDYYSKCNFGTKGKKFGLNPDALEYTPAASSLEKKDSCEEMNSKSFFQNLNSTNSFLDPESHQFSSKCANAVNKDQKHKSNSCEILDNKICDNPESTIYVANAKETDSANNCFNEMLPNGCTYQQKLNSNEGDSAFSIKTVNCDLSLSKSNENINSTDANLSSIKGNISDCPGSENSKIKRIQTQILPILKELCSENFESYRQYIDVCIKPYMLKKIPKTATIGTETDIKSFGNSEHFKRLAEALNVVNKQLTEKNSCLENQLESVTKEKQKLLEEVSELKTNLSSSSLDLEVLKIDYKKKEEALLNGREYLLKSLTDAHTSIDEHKKRIEILEKLNSSLEDTVVTLNQSLTEADKKMRDALEAQQRKTDHVLLLEKANEALKNRIKHSEIQFLQIKKTEYLNRIKDKLQDTLMKKKEFTQGLSMMSGNLNPVVQSSMKTIFLQFSNYENDLNACKLQFVKKIDEQIDKVEKGASLSELKAVEVKIPDPPHMQSLFPEFDKSLLNSSQMSFNLLNTGSFPQMPPAALPAVATTAQVPVTLSAAAAITSTNVSGAMVKPPIMTPSNLPASVNLQSNVPTEIVIPQAASSVIQPPNLIASALPSVKPTQDVIKKETFNSLNSQIQQSLKSTSSSVNSFSSIPTVPTLDKEFNKTCALFKPPDAVPNSKLDTPKIPPGIVNSISNPDSLRAASNSFKNSLETFPLGEKALGNISTSSKINDSLPNISKQVKKKIPGSKSGNSYDKLLGKLKEQFPSYSEDELMAFVREFRSKRQGKLTGMPMDAIISEVKCIIQAKAEGQTQQKIPEVKVQPKPNKVLVNKKLASDVASPATSEQPITKKKSAWGCVHSDDKKNFSGNADDDCSICCDPMTNETAYKVACGHFFHEECIRLWLKNKSNCPVCRVLLLLPEEYPSLS